MRKTQKRCHSCRRLRDFLLSRYLITLCISVATCTLIVSSHHSQFTRAWLALKWFHVLESSGGWLLGSLRDGEHHMNMYEEPIDAVYTWVNGSDPQLIEDLLKTRRELWEARTPKANLSISSSSSWDEFQLNKCSANRDFYYLEVPIGFLERQLSDFPVSLLDARELPTSSNLEEDFKKRATADEAKSASDGRLFYFKHIDQVRTMAALPLTPGKSRLFSTFIKLKCSDGRSFESSESGEPFDKLHSSTSSSTTLKKVASTSLIWLSTSSSYSSSSPRNANRSLSKDLVLEVLPPRARRFVNDIFIGKNGEGALISLISAFHAAPLVVESLKRAHLTGLQCPVQVIVANSAFLNVLSDPVAEEVSSKRFADNQELKYSLRSLDKYAPWVRNVYIVTNGQIPNWLNTANPRVKIVTHKDIFANQSHLPTFSSPAIEVHLHRIPGLSKRFIYLNDDIIFGAPVYPDDFHTKSRGFKIYLAWPVPDCEQGCPANWISDGFCDKTCNTSACQFDGGDCLGKNPPGSLLGNLGGPSIGRFGSPAAQQFPWQARGQPRGQHYFNSNGPNSPSCSSSCVNSWLGDQFCDKVCNNKDCAYDLGDCGVELFAPNVVNLDIGQFHPLPNGGRKYNARFEALNSRAIHLNLSELFEEASNGSEGLELGWYHRNSQVRAVALNARHKVLTILLVQNYTQTNVSLLLEHQARSGANRTQDKAHIELVVARGEGEEQTQNISKDSSKGPNNSSVDNASKHLVVLTSTDKSHSISPIVSAAAEPEIAVTFETFAEGETGPKILELFSVLNNAFNLTINGSFIGSMLNDLALLQHKGPANLDKGNLPSEEREPDRPLPLFSTPLEPFRSRSVLDQSLRTISSSSRSSEQFEGSLSYRPHPWEKRRLFADLEQSIAASELSKSNEMQPSRQHRSGRRLLDVYADSLRHVNRLYNKVFGAAVRKVPAHMAHLVDVDIVQRLQGSFPADFEATSSHRIRSSKDMQFAFSYFYFLTSETVDTAKSTIHQLNVSESLEKFDTDSSGSLSARELRSLMANLLELPLERETVLSFIGTLEDCGAGQNSISLREHGVGIFTLQVEKDLALGTLSSCGNLSEKIAKHHTQSPRKVNKFEIVSTDESSFKMIRSNASLAAKELDESRKSPKKFMCFNDDMDPTMVSETVLVRELLEDFYLSLVPLPSQFELPPGQSNPFLYTWQREAFEAELWLSEMAELTFVFITLLCLWLVLSFKARIYGPLVLWARRRRRRRGHTVPDNKTWA